MHRRPSVVSVTPGMSTFMIEPGARLAGRYRLDELVNEAGGATFWKATDETLARLVAVWTFTDGFPRTGEVVRAARATSRVADSRLTQVFDADDSGPTPYVVEEWVVGKSLTDLLAQGPLDPQRAAGLIAEAAEALATAHAAGLAHLRLTPGKLIWSAGGAVKVTGIGVDAALHGITAAQPATADAQGLGRLLYAALTAHWPDGDLYGLRAAPLVSSLPYQPNQIRSDVPERLNEIVCRSAFQAPLRGGPMGSAREIAEALADVPRLVPLPVAPATSAPPEPARGTSRHSGEFGVAAPEPAAPPRPSRSRRANRPPNDSAKLIRILVGAIAVLVFVGVVIAAWNIGSSMNGAEDPDTTDNRAGVDDGAKDEETEQTILEPESADGFDPEGDDGSEHNDKAGLAIDGDPSTAWNTQGYNGADLGNLKSGVGLIIDLGATSEVHEVSLVLGTAGPANVEILVGDERDMATLKPGGEPAGKADAVSGETDIELTDPVEGRYVVVWFTKLPKDGKYRGTINEVELRGKT